MKNPTRVVAEYLANKMNHYTQKDGLELQKMTLGLEVVLINVSKMIIIYVLAALLGTLWQTFVIHLAFTMIKRYSFGLHALSSTVCTIVSCTIFVFVPFVMSSINTWLRADIVLNIGNHIVAIAFAVIILILYMYAPADTKARPIIGEKNRAWLKKKAIKYGIILAIITLLIPDGSEKLLLVFGAGVQSVCLLPITYKILKRSKQNYEAYECA